MVWTGGGGYRLAPALLTLLSQLRAAYPGPQWVASRQTGTVGDLAHQAEASNSDHNPWLDRTVRALDVAANVTGVPGIDVVTDAPDCEALFAMVNRMYAARDPRVWPNGYAIYRYRVTDWDHPGRYHAQQGDPHRYHLHISVGQDPAGYDSTAPWPLPAASIPPPQEDDLPNYTDWPQKDRDALANDVATALVRRPMGGVNYPGSYADMMKATLDAARTAAATSSNIAAIKAAVAELNLPAGIDADALATNLVAKIGEKLGSTQ